MGLLAVAVVLTTRVLLDQTQSMLEEESAKHPAAIAVLQANVESSQHAVTATSGLCVVRVYTLDRCSLASVACQLMKLQSCS